MAGTWWDGISDSSQGCEVRACDKRSQRCPQRCLLIGRRKLSGPAKISWKEAGRSERARIR